MVGIGMLVNVFRLALDIAQTPTQQVVYIEISSMVVQIAEGVGNLSIFHIDFASTREKLGTFGLLKIERATHEID